MNNITDQVVASSASQAQPTYLGKSRFANFSLRTKLIISFVLTGVLAAGLIAVVTNFLTRQALTNNANEALLAAAQQTANTLDAFIATQKNSLRTQAQLPTLVRYLSLPEVQRPGSVLETEASQILRVLAEQEPQFISSYALLDRQGIDVLDTNAAEIGLDRSDRDYFKLPLQTGMPFASPVQRSETTDDFAIYFSSPVYNTAGEIIGVLRVLYDAEILQQLVVQENNLAGSQSFPVLFDEHHIHLAHGIAPETILKSVALLEPARLVDLQAARRLPNLPAAELSTNLPDLEQKLARAADEPYFAAEDVATGSKINQVAVAKMETQPWLVAFFQPREVFLASVENQTRALVLLTTFITLGVGLAALVVAQLLARPIVRLTRVAQQVTAGDLEVQATVESRDEIGQLSEAFNQMTAQLRSLIGSLEGEVRERTADLALSMEVGQRAAAIRELSQLLPTITEFIRQQFNLYYTQVYFIDDLGKNLVLKSGTGTTGQELLNRRHSLPVGAGSIVGRVAGDRKSIVVPDTQNSDIHRPNPLLPETRSELAIPLIVENRVIGVLDMQANQVNTFTADSIRVFEAMATQLAVSIDSAQQWALAQEAQRKSEETVKQLTRQGWAERLAVPQENLGFSYDLSTIASLSKSQISEGEAKQVEEEAGKEDKTSEENQLAVPIVVQNEPIGHLAVELPSQRNFSVDEYTMLAAVAQQLAQKAENLRLFEQTQQRAAREQLARRIVDKIRSSRDIESALKTAAEELAKSLGAARAVVDLRVAPVNEPTPSNGKLE